MRLQQIRTLKELESIKDTWQSFEKIEDGASIFQSWIWNRTWIETVLNHQKKSRLNVQVLEDTSGRILGILPFFDQEIAGSMIKLTQFLGHRMSYHNDILLSDPQNMELAATIVALLLKNNDFRTVLHLRHLVDKSFFTKQLLSEGYLQTQCKRVWVEASEEFREKQQQRLGRSKRKTLRWAENTLRKKFNSQYCVVSGDDFPKALDKLIDLHQLRFDSMGRSSVLVDRNLTFLREASKRLSTRACFEITQLIAQDKVIASMLMARDKDRYFFIQSGFDPEFARYSPIRLLISKTLGRGFEELGCQYFDMGPDYEPYKYEWKPFIGTNYFCSIGGVGPYAKSLAFLHRLAFRRSLPKT